MKIWPFPRPRTETKNLPEDTGSVCVTHASASIFGGKAAASVALRIPVVANAVQIISEACATLDISVVEIDGQAERRIDGHPVEVLLRGQVNGWTSSFEFIRELVVDALTDDRGGLAWVGRIGSEPREIIRYAPGFIAWEADAATSERKYTLNSQPIPASDLIHILPPLGRSPLTLAWESVKTIAALGNHAQNLFNNGARPSGLLKFPTGMGESAVKKSLNAWRQSHEVAGGHGRTAVLHDGADFMPLTFNSTDAQFMENWKFQIQEIARAFNLPAPMVGDLERATWGNAEQKGREFLSYSLEPWLRALEGGLGRALLPENEQGRLAIRFDRDDLTRADLSTRATVINSLISSRTINPNEGRSWLGLPPREGGDEFSNPNISAEAPKALPDATKNEGNDATQ